MSSFERLEFLDTEERVKIYEWSERRRKKYRGFRKNLYLQEIFAFDKGLLRSFLANINVIVVVQMLLAGVGTFLCKYLGLTMDVHVTLFVSPLVFPLAFSINADFQRREKVLEDLANFKASTMVWYFCLRDWREAAGLQDNFMKAASNKIKSLMFHLREYLLTEKELKRNFILRVLYEDFSDIASVNERIRNSDLPNNAPLMARVIHLHNLMCWSFEKLRVIREYRSPRSIRAFTKIFIFTLPILLAPYYVHLSTGLKNNWSAYYIAVLVSFMFGTLQGVQDKLDDPFDGMSEDDIDLEQLDEWTIQSLEATANRDFKVGRFTVSVSQKGKIQVVPPSANAGPEPLPPYLIPRGSINPESIKEEAASGIQRLSPHRRAMGLLPWQRQLSQIYAMEEENAEDLEEQHPYSKVLSNLRGDTTILRGGHIKEHREFDDMTSSNVSLASGYPTVDMRSIQRSVNSQKSLTNSKKVSFNQLFFDANNETLDFHQLATSAGATSVSQEDTPRYVSSNIPSSLQQLFASPISSPDSSSIPTDSIAVNVDGSARRRLRTDTFGSIPDEDSSYPVGGVASYINSLNKEKQRRPSAPGRSSPSSHGNDSEVNRDYLSDSPGTPRPIFEIGGSEASEKRPKFKVKRFNSLDIKYSASNGLPVIAGSPNISVDGDENVDNKSTTNLFDEKESVDHPVSRSLNSTPTKFKVSGTKKKNSMIRAKAESDPTLEMHTVGSQESLSSVIGKLKDEEVFL